MPRVSDLPLESREQEIPLELIDAHALEVIRRLRDQGHKAYLVGGCVRDLLLELPPKDFDVATSARPEEIKSIFRNCRIIGRRFRLAHVFFRGGKIIETSTFRAITPLPGEEGDEEQDLLIRRDNVFGSEEEDALRRDFTINALFYDIGSGRIIDHIGGLEDLRTRYLRMIGDPDIRLREDPIRILRAVRFAAKLDLGIDGNLSEAMCRYRSQISRCASARVLEETLRLLRMGNARKTVKMMEETGILEGILPEIHEYIAGPWEIAPPPSPPNGHASEHEQASESGDVAEHGQASESGTQHEDVLTSAASSDAPRVSDAQEVVSEAPVLGAAVDPTNDVNRRFEQMSAHLSELDRLIKRRSTSDAVVLASILYSPVDDILRFDRLRASDRNLLASEFVTSVCERLSATRRLSEQIRQIFIAQKHLPREQGPKRTKRRTPPNVLVRKAFFSDAIDLYEIHTRASERSLVDLEWWRAKAAETSVSHAPQGHRLGDSPPRGASHQGTSDRPAGRRRGRGRRNSVPREDR